MRMEILPDAAPGAVDAGSGTQAVAAGRAIPVWASYVATLAVAGFGVLFYTRLSPFHIRLYDARWTPHTDRLAAPFSIDIATALWAAVLVYGICLIPYYLLRPGRPGNAAVAFGYALRRLRHAGSARPTEAERQALLCLLLKFLFIPFCINGAVAYLSYLNAQVLVLAAAPLPATGAAWFDFYNRHLHYFLLNIILLFDFVPFVIGYLVQSQRLGNDIVSVDASLLGWVACVLCYPPFNDSVSQFFPWQVNELAPAYPLFPAAVHIALNLLLLACFGVYAWASVSLGFKCSNLTNRGTVSRGPYRWVRHPAYAFKNLAWWLGALPVFMRMADSSALAAAWGVCSLAGWTGIYALRAVTEERHMLRVDTGYARYAGKVRYRFVPGVW